MSRNIGKDSERPLYEIGYGNFNSCQIFSDRVSWVMWRVEIMTIALADIESVSYENGLPLIRRPHLEFALKNGTRQKLWLFGLAAKFTGRHEKGVKAVELINRLRTQGAA